MATIGFILLTHNKPQQIIRLISTLNSMFDYPQIVCHHDFSKSNLPVNDLSENVSLVSPHLQVSWATFSVIDAMLSAIQMMYENKNSPDWIVLLSGSDYPIKPAKAILSDLASSSFDVHIHHEQINYNTFKNCWQASCYDRYCSVKIQVPFLTRKLSLTKRQITLRHPLLLSQFTPFSDDLRCFAGEFWFCANRKATEHLIEFHSSRPALASHYRRLDDCPDESYCHTIFCNTPQLKISQNNLRYTDWSQGGAHPKTLLLEDLPKIYASSAHFARKFDIDVDVRILNELDSIIR